MEDIKITIKQQLIMSPESQAIVQHLYTMPNASVLLLLLFTIPLWKQKFLPTAAAPLIQKRMIQFDHYQVTNNWNFLSKASPDKSAFVEVDADVKQGDILCVVEAMKLFNEIESN